MAQLPNIQFSGFVPPRNNNILCQQDPFLSAWSQVESNCSSALWEQRSYASVGFVPFLKSVPLSIYDGIHNILRSIKTLISCSSSSSNQFKGSGSVDPLQTTSSLCSRKRKPVDLSSDYTKPAKILVNEERMSASMSGLHLDNNNLDVHPDLEQHLWYSHQTSSTNSGSLTAKSDVKASKTSLSKNIHNIPQSARLELCQELELGFKTKQLLPKVILDELNKPSMQMVLWRPPGDFVREIIKDVEHQMGEEDLVCESSQEQTTVFGGPSIAIDNTLSCSQTLDDEMDL